MQTIQQTLEIPSLCMTSLSKSMPTGYCWKKELTLELSLRGALLVTSDLLPFASSTAKQVGILSSEFATEIVKQDTIITPYHASNICLIGISSTLRTLLEA